MASRSIALGNDPVAHEAAEEHLLAGGSAIGAVLTGFFASSGAYAGVLLGSVSILIGGVGSGVRAFDGRLRQPGLGSKRPRGFKQGEEIPDAARVAVPTSVAAALVAAAYDGDLKLRSVMKPGIDAAVRSGAEERAELLRRIRSVGAKALTEPAFVRPLLRLAGPSEGGLLSPADFGAIPDLDQAAVERQVDGVVQYETPWAAEAEKVSAEGSLAPSDAPEGIGYGVVAVDARGVCAALYYERTHDGILVDDLDLEIPLSAIPVKRGVARVTPGARLPAPAPIGLIGEAGTSITRAIAAPASIRLAAEAHKAPPLMVERDPDSHQVRAQRL